MSNDKYQHILTFKDFRGFKKVQNIKERYKIGRVLGEGSFG
jgi:calcium-dependent protein kinase